jgi:hypothetical protein
MSSLSSGGQSYMNQKQILIKIIEKEIALLSDDLISAAERIIVTYKEPLKLKNMKKAQMQSLANIARNTQNVGDVISFIKHQTGKDNKNKTWGNVIDDKSFGRTVIDKTKEVVKQAQGILDVSIEKLQDILKEQGQDEATIEDKDKKYLLHDIEIILLRNFIQHLTASYEVEGELRWT